METKEDKVTRLPVHVDGQTLFRFIVRVTLLVGVLSTLASCRDVWPISTWINGTDVPVYVTNNNNGTTVLRAHEEHSFPGGFYATGDREAPAFYTIRAYEFLPGKGLINGWTEIAEGSRKEVYGGQGDLLFTATYTQEQVEAMNYTVTITRNVFPGQTPPASLP